MKVIVVMKVENVAFAETFSERVGITTIVMTDKVYHRYTTILGVYVSADEARKAIENEKMELIKKYGKEALDDENIADKHTFYTFASRVLEVEGNDKWDYLKEHITEMCDADGELNQKQTCQFILELMGVIEREGDSE